MQWRVTIGHRELVQGRGLIYHRFISNNIYAFVVLSRRVRVVLGTEVAIAARWRSQILLTVLVVVAVGSRLPRREKVALMWVVGFRGFVIVGYIVNWIVSLFNLQSLAIVIVLIFIVIRRLKREITIYLKKIAKKATFFFNLCVPIFQYIRIFNVHPIGMYLRTIFQTCLQILLG